MMKKQILSWVLLAALFISFSIPVMAADAAKIGQLDFDENLVWSDEGGLSGNSGIQTKDGENFLKIERDLNSGRAASFQVETKLRNADRISVMRLAYRFCTDGWFQMRITLKSADGQTLASQMLGGDANFVEQSANYAVTDLELNPTEGDVAYIQFDINGYNSSATLQDCCQEIDFSTITFLGTEESSYTIDETGVHYTFDSNSSMDGFVFEEGCLLSGEPDGTMTAELTKPGAGMYTQEGSVQWEAKKFSNIMLNIQNETSSELLKLYFTTDTMESYSEDACFLVEVESNQKTLQKYLVNTISNQYWRGTITGLRIVPAQETGCVIFDELGILYYPFTITDELERITISGTEKAFSNQEVSLQVLKSGKKELSSDLSELLWMDEVLADQRGSFAFEIHVPEAEVMDTYFVSIAGKTFQYDWRAEHKNPNYEAILMDTLMKYTKDQNIDALSGLLQDNQSYLSEISAEMRDFWAQNGEISWLAGSVIAENKTGSLSDFENSLKQCAAGAGLLAAKDAPSFLSQYAEILELSKLSAWESYQECTKELKEQILSGLQKQKPETLKALQEKFSESVVLITIEKSMGYEPVKKCIEENSTIIGISTDRCNQLKYPGRVYQALAGKRFASKDSILKLYEKKIVSGKEEGKFFPNDEITREEFVKLIVCAFSIEQRKTTSFSDVLDAWYAPFVGGAERAGIVFGLEDDRFGIGEKITRQDIAVMLCRAAKLLESENIAEFDDWDNISDYAKGSVAALYESGIISGNGEGSFLPRANATRAEAAVMLAKLMEMQKGETA